MDISFNMKGSDIHTHFHSYINAITWSQVPEKSICSSQRGRGDLTYNIGGKQDFYSFIYIFKVPFRGGRCLQVSFIDE